MARSRRTPAMLCWADALRSFPATACGFLYDQLNFPFPQPCPPPFLPTQPLPCPQRHTPPEYEYPVQPPTPQASRSLRRSHHLPSPRQERESTPVQVLHPMQKSRSRTIRRAESRRRSVQSPAVVSSPEATTKSCSASVVSFTPRSVCATSLPSTYNLEIRPS